MLRLRNPAVDIYSDTLPPELHSLLLPFSCLTSNDCLVHCPATSLELMALPLLLSSYGLYLLYIFWRMGVLFFMWNHRNGYLEYLLNYGLLRPEVLSAVFLFLFGLLPVNYTSAWSSFRLLYPCSTRNIEVRCVKERYHWKIIKIQFYIELQTG